MNSEEFLSKTGLTYYHNRIKTQFASKSEVPTKTSDLTNDSNFITGADIPISITQDGKLDIIELQSGGDNSVSMTVVNNGLDYEYAYGKTTLASKDYVDSQSGGGLTVTTYGNADFTYLNNCVAYSTTAGNVNEPTATKYGRVVNLSGAFKNVEARPDTAAFDIGKVPTGCEPLKTQYILSQGTTQYKFLLTIKTDGTINVSRYSATATNTAVPANVCLNINATYISAS